MSPGDAQSSFSRKRSRRTWPYLYSCRRRASRYMCPWERRESSMNSENQVKIRVPQIVDCRGWNPWGIRVMAVLLVMLLCAGVSSAYSVLTHEQIVDLLWIDELRPLLLQRFPG